MNASIKDIELFLRTPGKIAILGASTNTEKAGYFVPKYLRKIGFDTLLINPIVDEIEGIPTYKSLDDLPIKELKGIIIYRRLPAAEEIALNAIDLGIPVIWLPLRITSVKAKAKANQMDIMFVEDNCPLDIGEKLKI
ncbi:MAG: hypothetical protein GPJ54_14035 [Candidatus Heimdallarchaeota archaeon]|nr:hypothetical protein [Candidatus Heimdallarchaeota archaeon]